MTEPMQLQGIFAATISAALVVLAGAMYALFFALGRLHKSRALMLSGWASYGVLALSCLVLARSLELQGFWIFVVVVMLLGYLLLPQAIWHLCVGTHGHSDESELTGNTKNPSPRRATP